MKECFKCNEVKPLSEFYKHKMMTDGHVNKCKECNKLDVQVNRLKNVDYYREYDAYRYGVRGDRVKERRDYIKKWRLENPDKYHAHTFLNNAIRDGRLNKPCNCEKCKSFTPSRKLHAHHLDYYKPLDVRWLCAVCHAEEHPRGAMK